MAKVTLGLIEPMPFPGGLMPNHHFGVALLMKIGAEIIPHLLIVEITQNVQGWMTLIGFEIGEIEDSNCLLGMTYNCSKVFSLRLNTMRLNLYGCP